MRLVFEDVETNEVIVNIEATKVIDEHFAYWVVDFDSSVYKTYAFMIDCALYGLNEGQMFSDSYDDDDGKPLANWALLDDFVECAQVDDGFVCQWFDGEVITHDEFFETYDEVLAACDTYIKAGLFGSYVS